MNAMTDKAEDARDVYISAGSPYKRVNISVVKLGDRPDVSTQVYPRPEGGDEPLRGNAQIGPYLVSYDWPEGGEAKIMITP